MNKFYSVSIVAVYFVITALLVSKVIDTVSAGTLFIFWTALYFIFAAGIDSINELTAGQLKIRRELQAAKKIREEIAEIAKLAVENEYILANTGLLPMGGENAAKEKLETNLEELAVLSFGSKQKADKWWSDIMKLFAHRQNADK